MRKIVCLIALVLIFLFVGNASTIPPMPPSSFTNPMSQTGDIIIGGASGTPTRLGIGSQYQVLQAGPSTLAYSPVYYPASLTSNGIVYGSATNTMGQLSTGNGGVLVTSASGVPSISATLPAGLSIPTPSMTPQVVDGHTGASPSAANLSNAMLTNYGQTTANVSITGPTPAAGMNFIMIMGTAQGSNYWRYTSTGTNLYLDGGSAVTYVGFAAPAVGNAISCFSFQTGSSTYSLKCTTLAGTSTSG
ncbi:MAG: hypothetical protein ACLQGU_19735 [bacterium]